MSGHKIRKAGRCFLLGLGEIIYGPYRPIAYYVLGGGRGFGGEYNFLRGLILRVNLENAQNVRGSKY